MFTFALLERVNSSSSQYLLKDDYTNLWTSRRHQNRKFREEDDTKNMNLVKRVKVRV